MNFFVKQKYYGALFLPGYDVACVDIALQPTWTQEDEIFLVIVAKDKIDAYPMNVCMLYASSLNKVVFVTYSWFLTKIKYVIL